MKTIITKNSLVVFHKPKNDTELVALGVVNAAEFQHAKYSAPLIDLQKVDVDSVKLGDII
jgi:hypothetical protein